MSLKKRLFQYHRKFILFTILIVLVYIKFPIEERIKMLQNRIIARSKFLSGELDEIEIRKITMSAKLSFITDFKYLMTSRFTHGDASCNMTWSKKNAIPWMKKTERTDVDKSYFAVWNIKPAGEFSKIVLKTQYINSSLKHQGGDYWRVFLRGSSAIPVIKTDLGNGSYEFMFLPVVSGKYSLGVSLEYTLCDGIKEPPKDWFIKGNIQGKEQKHGILFYDMPYINKSLWSNDNIYFDIPPPRLSLETREMLLQESCREEQSSCNYLWNGYGSWMNKTTWKPLCKNSNAIKYPRKKEGILWIFGDSVASQFYHRIKKNKICKQIFKNCLYSYNWIYSLENYNISMGSYVRRNSTAEKKTWDDRDFNVTKIIEQLKQALYHPSMDEKSVILLNYGLHFTEATNFTNFKNLITKVIELQDRVKCKIVWRTTTSLNRHKYSMPNLHSRRFMTSQRVQLYNAYATNKFCKAGFDILDIYPLTDSYPFGTGNDKSPTDPVHYEYHVMKPMENVLENVFGASND